jgi:hypothetical protein
MLKIVMWSSFFTSCVTSPYTGAVEACRPLLQFRITWMLGPDPFYLPRVRIQIKLA